MSNGAERSRCVEVGAAKFMSTWRRIMECHCQRTY